MRKKILVAIVLCALGVGSFSSLWTSVVQAQSPFPFHLVRDSRSHAADSSVPVPNPMTTRSHIPDRPLAQPTPTATQAIPAIADPTVILTFAGVIGAFIAVVVMLFALRGKGNK